MGREGKTSPSGVTETPQTSGPEAPLTSGPEAELSSRLVKVYEQLQAIDAFGEGCHLKWARRQLLCRGGMN